MYDPKDGAGAKANVAQLLSELGDRVLSLEGAVDRASTVIADAVREVGRGLSAEVARAVRRSDRHAAGSSPDGRDSRRSSASRDGRRSRR